MSRRRTPDPSRPWSAAATPWLVRPGAEDLVRAWLENPRRSLPIAAPRPGVVGPELVPDYFREEQVEVRPIPRRTEKGQHYWTGEALESARTLRHATNGYTIYRGPSRIDGAPIVVIATGFRKPSTNRKTGPMIQTWIMREDLRPTDAVATGADRSICGDCPHRGGFGYKRSREKRGGRTVESVMRSGVRFRVGAKKKGPMVLMPYAKGRSCYVVVSQAPDSVWKSYHEGKYPFVPIGQLPDLFADSFPLRVGSYGEPVAAPDEVWRAALERQFVWTGYTHGWDLPGNQVFRDILMASVDSLEEQHRAAALGWRTFRIGSRGEPPQLVAGVEIVCPATPEGGRRRKGSNLVETTTCDACGLCMGASKKARSIVVAPHGSGTRYHEERVAGGYYIRDEWAGDTHFPPGYFANPGAGGAPRCYDCQRESPWKLGLCARCLRARAVRKPKPPGKRPSRMTSDDRRAAKKAWKVGTRVRTKLLETWDVEPDGSVRLGPDGKPVLIHATGTIVDFRAKGSRAQVQVAWDQAARMSPAQAARWVDPWWDLEALPPTAGPLFEQQNPPDLRWLFSYGSNHPGQLSSRIGRQVNGVAAYVDGQERVFRGWSQRWGGGVASLNARRGARTYGYVAQVSDAELQELDRHEGVAAGKYRRAKVKVTTTDGRTLSVVVYVSTSTDYAAPSQAYLEAVATTVGSFWSDEGRRVVPSDFPLRNPGSKGYWPYRPDGKMDLDALTPEQVAEYAKQGWERVPCCVCGRHSGKRIGTPGTVPSICSEACARKWNATKRPPARDPELAQAEAMGYLPGEFASNEDVMRWSQAAQAGDVATMLAIYRRGEVLLSKRIAAGPGGLRKRNPGNPSNPGHPHPRIKLPVSRAQVEGELAYMHREAGLPGVAQAHWPSDLTRLHERRPRRYAQVFTGVGPGQQEPRYELAEQTRWLPEPQRIGLLAHEVGHVLDPRGGEAGADAAAERVFGVRIEYDDRWPAPGLQSARW